jgi:hydrogenase maturation protease
MYFVRNTFSQIESGRSVTTTVAVIGIGQSLRGDDGAGPEAVRQWLEKFQETANRPEVRVAACELPGLNLLDMLQEADGAILVDAVQSSNAPGTIHHLSEEELSAFMSDSKSAHGWGVAETLRLGSHLMMKKDIRIIGIEAEQMKLGTGLSGAVSNAIPAICSAIEKEVNNLLK